MTSRSFRRLFPQLNVQFVPEDEFYRQASLSQLLTGPDEQELASFRPDVKDPLELVEATPELAGMLGSSLEFVDSRWDCLEASPPPTPSPPPSPRQLQCAAPPSLPLQQETEAGAQSRAPEFSCRLKQVEYSVPAAKLDASMWEAQTQGSQHPGVSGSAHPEPKTDSSMWKQQTQGSQHPGVSGSAHPDPKTDSSMWKQRQGSKTSGIAPCKSDRTVDANMWEPQRLRRRSAGNSDTKLDTCVSEPARLRSKKAAHLNGEVKANLWKHQGSKASRVLNSSNPAAAFEPQRLRSKNSGMSSAAKLDPWARQGVKGATGTCTAPKREANAGEGHVQTVKKTIKMDAAWQRNLTNVRVHIRDLGMKVGTIQRDVNKDPGKVVGKGSRTKTRS